MMGNIVIDGADAIEIIADKHNYCLSNDIENLVFRGGGVKGLAYCGALNVLAHMGKLNNVRRYAGSSAGAITAALLAVGYSADELEVIFKQHEFQKFKDSDGLLDRAGALYKNFGLYKGKVFYDWIGKMLEDKCGNADITFEQVFTTFGKEVVIVGTCITHTEVHYFSTYTTQDMSLRDAVRISMSIPLFFEPVILGEHIFVDGGVTDNFPLSVFDADGFEYETSYRHPVNKKTLGFFLAEDKNSSLHVRNVRNLKNFVSCLLDTVKQRIAYLAIKPGDELRTIEIQTRYISSTRFNISDQEKDLLFHEGQSAAMRFLGLKKGDSPDMRQHGGRLIVKVIEGVNLRENFLPDDPYCILTIGEESKKTSIKYKTVNPVWKEIFVFKISDTNEPLKLQVYDYKFLRAPKHLSSLEIPIASLPCGIATDMWIHLTVGKVHLELTYSS